jgi:signal transduction histidine kinase
MQFLRVGVEVRRCGDGLVAEPAGHLGDRHALGQGGADLDETLAHDILAVTREALSNCARHARATAVSITLARHDGLITLDITDNGRGLGTPARSSGLASMRRRAERNGGTLQITAPAGGGTRLTWTARQCHGRR